MAVSVDGTKVGEVGVAIHRSSHTHFSHSKRATTWLFFVEEDLFLSSLRLEKRFCNLSSGNATKVDFFGNNSTKTLCTTFLFMK